MPRPFDFCLESLLQSSTVHLSDLHFFLLTTDFCGFTFSIGAQTGLDGKLSSHRSDYEIHSPEHRSIPKRPQSTAELVSLLLSRNHQNDFSLKKKQNKTKTF